MSDNKKNKNNCLRMISEDYRKLQIELSNSKLEIISLEGQLIKERDLNAMHERNNQRSLQDLEQYKIRKVVEKPAYDLNEINHINVDLKSIFENNESLIKQNLELTQNISKIEYQLEVLNYKYTDTELELNEFKKRNNDLQSLNGELKTFIDEKKSELLDLNMLKARINVLENISKVDDDSPFLSMNINRIKELELKCFNLEKINDKLKENHVNLRLLGEENVSLSSENERLKTRLEDCAKLVTTKLHDRSMDSCSDMSTDRHVRHIERENEILKCQQAEISEQNAELKAKIALLEHHVKSLQQDKDNCRISLHDKEQRLMSKENEIRCLTKDCQSFKQVLATFTDQSVLDGNCEELSSKLFQAYNVLTEHKTLLEDQSAVLDQLMKVAVTHVNNMGVDSPCEVSMFKARSDIDRTMVLELRNEIEELNEELESRAAELRSAENRCSELSNDLVMARQQRDADLGLSATINTKDCNTNIFKKLNANLLEAVKQLLGYELEIGPNGYVSLHNCLSDDPTEVLEFTVHVLSGEGDAPVAPVLIENSYSRDITSQLTYRGRYPVLFASITLDWMERLSVTSSCSV